MALYKYLPYWRHIRTDLRETLAAMNDAMWDYSAHPALNTVGEIVLELASAQTKLLSWIENPDVEIQSFDPADYPSREDKQRLLEDQWQRLEDYANSVTREELTRQHPHPSGNGEFYSLYELLWELMRYEVHHMGKIELQLEAYKADNTGDETHVEKVVDKRTRTIKRPTARITKDTAGDAPPQPAPATAKPTAHVEKVTAKVSTQQARRPSSGAPVAGVSPQTARHTASVPPGTARITSRVGTQPVKRPTV